MVHNREKKMLYGDILVPHLFCLILCADQGLVKILADISLAAGYLRSSLNRLFQAVIKISLLDPHLLDEPGNQGIVLMNKRVQQVLLLDLLISVIRSNLLKIVDCFDRFLCKFLNIHKLPSFPDIKAFFSSLDQKCWSVPGSAPPRLYISPFVSHVNSRVLIFSEYFILSHDSRPV